MHKTHKKKTKRHKRRLWKVKTFELKNSTYWVLVLPKIYYNNVTVTKYQQVILRSIQVAAKVLWKNK